MYCYNRNLERKTHVTITDCIGAHPKRGCGIASIPYWSLVLFFWETKSSRQSRKKGDTGRKDRAQGFHLLNF